MSPRDRLHHLINHLQLANRYLVADTETAYQHLVAAELDLETVRAQVSKIIQKKRESAA